MFNWDLPNNRFRMSAVHECMSCLMCDSATIYTGLEEQTMITVLKTFSSKEQVHVHVKGALLSATCAHRPAGVHMYCRQTGRWSTVSELVTFGMSGDDARIRPHRYNRVPLVVCLCRYRHHVTDGLAAVYAELLPEQCRQVHL